LNSANCLTVAGNTTVTANFVAASLRFVPVTPCRIADTRGADGAFGAPSIVGGTSRDFVIPSSTCNIPSSAAAYSLNVTVVPSGPLAYVTIWPTGQAQPFDTRYSNGSLGSPSLSGGAVRDFPLLTSTCNVPATAQAYSLNFTAVPPGPLAYITVWPAGQTQPLVSTLNDIVAQIVANAAIVPAGANGDIDVYASNNTDLVIDINGYFAPAASGAL
jgi:hypothetical protein